MICWWRVWMRGSTWTTYKKPLIRLSNTTWSWISANALSEFHQENSLDSWFHIGELRQILIRFKQNWTWSLCEISKKSSLLLDELLPLTGLFLKLMTNVYHFSRFLKRHLNGRTSVKKPFKTSRPTSPQLPCWVPSCLAKNCICIWQCPYMQWVQLWLEKKEGCRYRFTIQAEH